MRSTTVFCPYCHTYMPTGLRCRQCDYQRTPLEVPAIPGEPLWTAQVSGGIAFRMDIAMVKEQNGLAMAWNKQLQVGRAGSVESGITLLRLEDGGVIWTKRFTEFIEGGVTCSQEFVLGGLKLQSPGIGQGWVTALDLASSQERWRQQLGGAVRACPATDGMRVYVGASDGALYCLDLATGRFLWRTFVYAKDEPTHITASPVIIYERGIFQAVIVATYGGLQGWETGKIVALDERGKKLWEQSVGGNVRSKPAYAEGILYVSAYQSSPSVGWINAFDAHTGKPHWATPFKIQGQAGDRTNYGFSSSALVCGDRLVIGSLNQKVYTLNAETGYQVGEFGLHRSIATTPVLVEGLVVFNTNEGFTCAVELDGSRLAWEHKLCTEDQKIPALTDPVVYENYIFSANNQGTVIALPWHHGSYRWAAQRLEKAGRSLEAGELRTLEALNSMVASEREEAYTCAEEDWRKAGKPERSARLWEALKRREKAAANYMEAGQRYQYSDCTRAALYFYRAAVLYFNLRRHTLVEECSCALASCADLPYIRMTPVNVGNFIQWEPGEFTLRLKNESRNLVPTFVRLWMGGALKSAQEAEIRSPMKSDQEWNIPLKITPTRAQSSLDIEIEYDTGDSVYPLQRGMISIPIEAVEQPRPPDQIIIGDVAMLSIAGATTEGLQIVTRDVGIMRSSTEISSVTVVGDAGAVSAGGAIEDVTAKGNIGVVRGVGHTEQEN